MYVCGFSRCMHNVCNKCTIDYACAILDVLQASVGWVSVLRQCFLSMGLSLWCFARGTVASLAKTRAWTRDPSGTVLCQLSWQLMLATWRIWLVALLVEK